MTTISLTKEQLVQIEKDMDKKVDMLSDSQINALARKVNEIINLPFLSKEKEMIVMAKLVKWVDRELYQLLPNEYYELINTSTDGISMEEATNIEKRITLLLNRIVNIPILTEDQEEKLISLVVGLIINAMIKGFALEEVKVTTEKTSSHNGL